MRAVNRLLNKVYSVWHEQFLIFHFEIEWIRHFDDQPKRLLFDLQVSLWKCKLKLNWVWHQIDKKLLNHDILEKSLPDSDWLVDVFILLGLQNVVNFEDRIYYEVWKTNKIVFCLQLWCWYDQIGDELVEHLLMRIWKLQDWLITAFKVD